MESLFVTFGLAQHYGWAIALLCVILFFFGVWLYKAIIAYHSRNIVIHDHVVAHHTSSLDPESDVPRQISQHELRTLLRQIRTIVGDKGCIDTCPALAKIVAQVEDFKRMDRERITEIRNRDAANQKNWEKTSLRVEGFIDEWGAGLMSMIKEAYTAKQGDLDRATRRTNDQDARDDRSR